MNLLTNFIIALNSDAQVNGYEPELIIRQARKAFLLGFLAQRLNKKQMSDAPEAFWSHLKSAEVIYNKQQEIVNWEVQQISSALEEEGIPVIFLKGAAYIAQQLVASNGRFLGDIDIMVPHQALDAVEERLKHSGWFPKQLSAYDEKYYRQWMHEIPPVRHFSRHTTLDIHHTILPPTVKLNIDAKKLVKNAIPIEGYDNAYTLSHEDMVLHSAAHLFHDGELEHGLRDLVDIDRLLNEFSVKDASFWQNLIIRAKELDLEKPLFYGLHYSKEILHSDVPDEAIQALKFAKPAWPMSVIMDTLFKQAFQPDHPSCDTWYTGFSRWLLYIRSHYLRMPLYLLIPHLFHKGFIAPYNEKKEAQKKLDNVQ